MNENMEQAIATLAALTVTASEVATEEKREHELAEKLLYSVLDIVEPALPLLCRFDGDTGSITLRNAKRGGTEVRYELSPEGDVSREELTDDDRWVFDEIVEVSDVVRRTSSKSSTEFVRKAIENLLSCARKAGEPALVRDTQERIAKLQAALEAINKA